MTDLRARLLAILKEEPYYAGPTGLWRDSARTHKCGSLNEATKLAADLNARHRLKRLCAEIAKALDEEAKLISNSTHCGSENSELRTATQGWRTMHTARKFILSLGEDNEHS